MAGGWAALVLAGGWRVSDARSGRQTPCPLAAVALAIDLDDRAVVHQPVHCRHRHGAGGEHVLPLAERLVAGHQQGAAHPVPRKVFGQQTLSTGYAGAEPRDLHYLAGHPP